MPTARETSNELKALKADVEEWRKRRGKRTRIPERFWAEAVRVAAIDGVWAASRATRFRYPELKQRLATAAPRPVVALLRTAAQPPAGGRGKGAAHAGSGAFVELSMDAIGAGARTVVELMGQSGDRMRIEAAGGVDLAGLARAFFGRDAR